MNRRRPCQAFGHWRQLARISYWGWIVGRPSVWVTDVVPDLGRDIRDFLQRGMWGYAESDLYSLDLYLSDWLPSALRAIRPALLKQPGGMLPSVVKGYGEDPFRRTTEKDWAAARRRYEQVLDGMIAGWETVNDVHRHDFETRQPGETFSQQWRRQKRTIKRGMRLMGKHILRLGL